MKKKLCFIVQRYGEEINGGAEAYCRIYAEKLSEIYDITVLTTCALDYQKWENYYPEESVNINNVMVHRFKVDSQRDVKNFGKLSVQIYGNPNHSIEESNNWIEKQGPVSNGIIKFLKEKKDDFDLFLCFTYLYWPTVNGIKQVKNKSILVPFCHDEPPVYLKCFDELFHTPKGIIFNTDEEREFVFKRFQNQKIPNIITGIGLDIPKLDYSKKMREKFKLHNPFILYMGRIDNSKGCDELFDYFIEYKRRYKNDLQLVLMGKEVLSIPKHKDIISLGFVSEEDKYLTLKETELLVLPSHFESLSIVVLEAFEFKKPVLVSGKCEVLKGHCKKSNAGLYFYGVEDFCECLNLLYENIDLRNAMGEKGKEYVNEYYQWDVIIDKFQKFIDVTLESL